MNWSLERLKLGPTKIPDAGHQRLKLRGVNICLSGILPLFPPGLHLSAPAVPWGRIWTLVPSLQGIGKTPHGRCHSRQKGRGRVTPRIIPALKPAALLQESHRPARTAERRAPARIPAEGYASKASSPVVTALPLRTYLHLPMKSVAKTRTFLFLRGGSSVQCKGSLVLRLVTNISNSGYMLS